MPTYNTTSTTDEETVFFPFAFMFDHYKDYDKGILRKRSERIIFEYLIFTSSYFLRHMSADTFWHSYKTIENRTGLSHATARKVITSFGGHGCPEANALLKIVITDSEVVKGSATTSFRLNYKALLSRLGDVYGHPSTLSEPQKTRLKKRRQALIGLMQLKNSLR